MPRVNGRRSVRTLREDQRIRRRNTTYVSRFQGCANKFESVMKSFALRTCISCKRNSFGQTENNYVCLKCQNNRNTYFTVANRMNIGSIPPQLKNLTLVEQCLIAQVHPVVSVFRIRGQQLAYSGHVMNFVQHIEHFCSRLPLHPSSLRSIILLTRETPNGIAEFRVRSNVVRNALIWLKRNNPYYHSVHIDEENLELLPEDGDVAQCLDQVEDVIGVNQDGISHENIFSYSLFPNIPQIDASRRINENLRRSFDPSEDCELSWPSQEGVPLNEFTTEGLICRAFPHLFPYGIGDLNSPRLTKIPRHEYFNFLMQYNDGRFANDSRFPYYAYNSLARWDAIDCGSIFIRRNRMEAFTNEDLDNMANAPDTDLASSIMYYGSNLRGTRAFWKQRCSELIQMVRQLGTPTFFFTLSAADYHWPDLYRIMNPTRDPNSYSERERRQIMHSNAATVAWFFKIRVDTFFKEFLVPLFKVDDFWYRYEWQHRGSPHVHGILWLPDAPNCSEIDSTQLGDEQRRSIADYFDQYISAELDRLLPPTEPNSNPCRIRLSDVHQEERGTDLCRLLSCMQRHTICGEHCLRKRRGSRQRVCRFGFPFERRERGELVAENGTWKFEPKRNDPLLQRYNQFISQVWRGNTDFSAIVSKDAVINYISKYAAKCETGSAAYSEVLRSILNRNSSETTAVTSVRQLLISSVAERNYSSQEVMHLIMSWPLYRASRTMMVLSLRDDWQRFGATNNTSFVIRYANRQRELHGLSLFNIAKFYRVSRGGLVRRRDECIVRVVPYTKLGDDPIQNDEYYRLQCKLHIPWTGSFEQIKPADISWEDFYIGNMVVDEIEIDEYEQLGDINIDDEFESDIDNEVASQRDPGMAASRLLPPNIPERGASLGHRVIDQSYEWISLASSGYTRESIETYLSAYKNAPSVIFREQNAVVQYSQMSESQREVVDIFMNQIENPMTSMKRTIVQGKAGTGKSAIIHYISMIASQNNQGCILLAPTGAAALNIDGKTIHSVLRIPLRGQLTPLNGESLRTFQLEFRDVRFVIIDEYSMVGLRLMRKVHLRLCEASGLDQPLGGYCVYLFGDLRQLPPVLDKAIYMTPQDEQSVTGYAAINSFQKKIVLTQGFRQLSDMTFMNILDSIAVGNVTQPQWQTLMRRRVALTPITNEFRDAISLYPTNQLVYQHNLDALASNRLPVSLIEAYHNNVTAKQANSNLADGLQASLHLSIGSRVMLRQNLCVSKGLVNGSLGTVKEIIYHGDDRPPSLPFVIMIEFDKFTGPFIKDKLYPLRSKSSTWRSGGVECQRRQFPINLAYALTIHKAQGLTLDKAIVNIGERESSVGLSYVALSRVRNLSDLIIQPYFNLNRLNQIGAMRQLTQREAFMRANGLTN